MKVRHKSIQIRGKTKVSILISVDSLNNFSTLANPVVYTSLLKAHKR